MGVTWPNFWAARANSSVRGERERDSERATLSSAFNQSSGGAEITTRFMKLLHTCPGFSSMWKKMLDATLTLTVKAWCPVRLSQTTLTVFRLQAKENFSWLLTETPSIPTWIFYVFFFWIHWNADSTFSEFTDHIHPCQHTFVERSHHFWGPLTCLPIWLKFL